MDNTEVNISQEIPAYERRYRKISEWFLNCKPAYAILKFISKLILTPFTSFILVSVIRKCIDAKRPYEKYNIKPLFVKNTKGESMPSRHVFSITIIAMCWLYVSVPVGVIMLILVVIMAASRVLAGVHFIRDVVAGFAVGIICGIAGLWLI